MSSGPRTEQLSMQDAAPSPVGGLGVVFLVAQPGLETVLLSEAIAAGFADAQLVPGGVEIAGGLAEAIRANHILRRAVRVLWRVAAFRALHLAQLDKRAKKLAWLDWLRPDQPVRVEAVCRSSKIYHDKAAVQRIAGAITAAGITIASDAALVIKARIEDDLCTISIDTSGEPLHRRGHKTFVGKAPLRETMAAGFLWQMGFDGSQAVVDPMCGSGTIVLEAAEIAARLLPGRSRDFAFAHLVGGGNEGRCPSRSPGYLENEDGARVFGFDRGDNIAWLTACSKSTITGHNNRRCDRALALCHPQFHRAQRGRRRCGRRYHPRHRRRSAWYGAVSANSRQRAYLKRHQFRRADPLPRLAGDQCPSPDRGRGRAARWPFDRALPPV